MFRKEARSYYHYPSGKQQVAEVNRTTWAAGRSVPSKRKLEESGLELSVSQRALAAVAGGAEGSARLSLIGGYTDLPHGDQLLFSVWGRVLNIELPLSFCQMSRTEFISVKLSLSLSFSLSPTVSKVPNSKHPPSAQHC